MCCSLPPGSLPGGKKICWIAGSAPMLHAAKRACTKLYGDALFIADSATATASATVIVNTPPVPASKTLRHSR